MLEVNVLGTLHAVRAALPHLAAAEHADVVTVSSMSGRRLASPELGVYAATKASVHMLSEGLRRELTPDGIRVTVVAPGPVDTPIFAGQQHPVATRLGDAAAGIGLSVEDVATRIVDVLAAPPHVVHVEARCCPSTKADRSTRHRGPRHLPGRAGTRSTSARPRR